MKISEIVSLLDGELICGEKCLLKDVSTAYSADLLSDVLALTEGDTMLITGNITLQVIRVAEILGINAIVFVRGKTPGEDVVAVAEKRLHIPIILTKKTMFETSGLLYKNGIQPCKNRPATEV